MLCFDVLSQTSPFAWSSRISKEHCADLENGNRLKEVIERPFSEPHATKVFQSSSVFITGHHLQNKLVGKGRS